MNRFHYECVRHSVSHMCVLKRMSNGCACYKTQSHLNAFTQTIAQLHKTSPIPIEHLYELNRCSVIFLFHHSVVSLTFDVN